MGKKGNKLTSTSVEVAEDLVSRLEAIGSITSKKMFGGHGIFHDSKMFGMVDSRGQCFLKTDDTNSAEFEAHGSQKHGRMPYYEIPEKVFEDDSMLIEWANKSIAATK